MAIILAVFHTILCNGFELKFLRCWILLSVVQYCQGQDLGPAALCKRVLRLDVLSVQVAQLLTSKREKFADLNKREYRGMERSVKEALSLLLPHAFLQVTHL